MSRNSSRPENTSHSKTGAADAGQQFPAGQGAGIFLIFCAGAEVGPACGLPNGERIPRTEKEVSVRGKKPYFHNRPTADGVNCKSSGVDSFFPRRENDSVMDGTTLFSRLRRPVMVNSDQTPQYADIRNAGHDGGDFIFIKKP